MASAGAKKKKIESRNCVFGTVVMMPRPDVDAEQYEDVRGSLGLPHILLQTNYQTGGLSLPGGKKQFVAPTKEPAKEAAKLEESSEVAFKRELQEETGFSTWETCQIYHVGTSQQGKRTVDYFVAVVPYTEGSEWRPALQPVHLGEVAGVAWLPLSHKLDTFPWIRPTPPPKERYRDPLNGLGYMCNFLANSSEIKDLLPTKYREDLRVLVANYHLPVPTGRAITWKGAL
jgi:8-oxo-dGTP pyrophosphatase MutT (NUDIX family)